MPSNITEKNQAQLEQQLNRRIAWWSMKRWCDVISIPSQPKGASLLTCDVNCLTSVKLFNLTSAQLEKKIQTYHKKPAWRRWIQRRFSSINQQIEALWYYQACLHFRTQPLSEQNLAMEISTIAGQSSDIQPSAVTSISTAQTFNEEKTKDIPANIDNWIHELREELNKMLSEKSKNVFTSPNFHDFHEKALKNFTNTFIQPLLQSIDDAQQDEETRQKLLKTLSEFYKKGLLFFHPDKSTDIINQDDTGELKRSWDNIFTQFQKSRENTQCLLKNKYKYSEKEIIDLFEQIDELDKISKTQNNQIAIETQRYIEKTNLNSEEQEKRFKTLQENFKALRSQFLFSEKRNQSKENCSLTEETSTQETRVSPSP